MKATSLLYALRDTAGTNGKRNEDMMKRVLVVDDDEGVRKMLCAYLLEQGFHAADAGSGPLALALFPLFHPKIVLLDICMPGMDGLEVLSQMKQLDPEVCVIMLTGMAGRTIAQQAMCLGADDYLTKPLGLELVKDRLMMVSELLQA